MKKNYLTLCLILITIFIACDKDNPTSPEELTGDLLATETIGSGGGILESENFKLTIPSGAFFSDVEIKLYSSAEENPFEENAISELYKIEGLPTDYSQPLQIRLKYQGVLTDSAAIAVGEDLYIKSLQSITTSFQLFSAKDSSGYLVCPLPIPAGNNNNRAGLSKIMHTSNSHGPLNVQGVGGITPFLSSGNHFKISSTDNTVRLQDAQALGDFLEAAFDTIKSLGFKHESKRKWPVKVTIKKLADKVFGYSAYSMWGGGYLEFNSKKLTDQVAMRLTTGHEFFHLVQSLYDPSWGLTLAYSETDQLWLDEATAVWIEEKFTDQVDYVSAVRAGFEMTPIKGAQKGSEEDAGKHGYGMSAMIKYLVDNFGQEIIVQIYEKISGGSKIIDAIESATDDPVNWYEKFLRQYVLGNIYNVQMASWLGEKSGEFKIETEGDTVKNFSGSYPDLSAKLYQIQLNYSNIDSSAKLNFNASGGTNEVTVFKYRSGLIQYVDNYIEKLTVPDVRKMKDEGWHLLALVTNARSVSPYTDISDINLEIKLTTPVWEVCYFLVDLWGHYKKEYLEYPDSVGYGDQRVLLAGWTKGEFTGDTFSGVWDTTETDGWFDRGLITVTLNDERDKISSFHIEQTSGHGEGHVFHDSQTDVADGINVPWSDKYSYVQLYYLVEGEETCNYLTSVESIWDAYFLNMLFTLESYYCNTSSDIEIFFDKDDLNLKKLFKEKGRRLREQRN
jgi:hypothetical protein